MKRNLVVVISIGVLSLGACILIKKEVSHPVLPTSNVTVSTPLPDIHLTETRVPFPSPTPLLQTTEEIPDCINIQSALPQGHSFPGSLLLVKPSVAPGDKQLLYNLLTDELSVLPQKYSVGHAVSPDHTQLALDDYDAKKLISYQPMERSSGAYQCKAIGDGLLTGWIINRLLL